MVDLTFGIQLIVQVNDKSYIYFAQHFDICWTHLL